MTLPRHPVSRAARRVRAAAAAAVLLCVIAGPAAAEARRSAPKFAVRTIQGEKISLDGLRARGPVLLDFWATWCKPCLAAIPELQKLHADLGPRGLGLVGISVDGPRNYSKVRPFVQRVGITYPIVLDEDGGLQQRYQAVAMPTTVLIDTAGAIVRVVQGYRPGEIDELRAAIEALMPAAAADSTAPTTP